MIDSRIIQAMVDRIVTAVHPHRIILFGSHARGDGGAASDIDLLVIQDSSLSRPKRSARLYSLLRDYPYSKDILVFTPQEVEEYRNVPSSFVMTALAEGRVLYEG